MAGIFKKLTQGVTQTGNRVRNVVDVNRLKVKTAQQKKELEKDYMQIGKIIFKSYQSNNDNITIEDAVLELCKRIGVQQKEVRQLQAKINDTKNLKQCPCGEVLSKGVKFCPICGNRFEDAI